MLARLKQWAKAVKRDVAALWIAARDPRVPRGVKLLCAVAAAYALSPIDLIPDFIPFVGYLDDAILLPLAILLAVRLMPPTLMAEFRSEAERRSALPASRAAAAAVLVVWLATSAALLWFFWPRGAR